MGNHLPKHQKKVRQQKVNRQENKVYYQNSTHQKNPRSDAERTRDRTLAAE
jgi:hypothetical protein